MAGNALVTGGNGGIGRAFVRYRADDRAVGTLARRSEEFGGTYAGKATPSGLDFAIRGPFGPTDARRSASVIERRGIDDAR